VSQGQAIFDPGIAARVIAATGAPQDERPFPVLTEREHEILDRLARGLRNDAIAARMGISVKTVQNNVSTILLKLGAVDRAQAVALARDAGMGRHS
jgi:DNA-binding NarL/FixJ family response regulator